MPADLHIHTSFSDGTDSPESIVELSKSLGINIIAITDHDTLDGILRAQEKGKEVGVEVIPGIEFTTETSKTEVHILGYFFDLNNCFLHKELKKIQSERKRRIQSMVQKLNKLGININAEEVFAIAGNDSPGRPHVARALIKAGIVSSFKEAFDRYLGFHGPAYASHYKLSPFDAVKLIRGAGGVAVYAHPGLSNCDEIIPDMILAGLQGIEVFYPTHSVLQIKNYTGLSEKYNLLMTGGSDFHGVIAGRRISLGGNAVPDELAEKLRSASEYLRRN
ncbi:hypothetical protein A3J90_08270 [candidate division WOR-1 bacterium RIFOXYC2_FULL_37_10]|uniref:Polymerase/histidinol phosphatase N-terminal domain-containing protein n=1 Tax=candidate division WOR-1 bacterium RIFOXYB2_FULL_37_13 TaxID=1802579 RepID=A0A1F4SQI5_UNCSA|nr:MAG: hypothetical protein A2246_04535 [candidate division WOR-1 bacterium RIFOXYA2_FULL_37_7]OGC22670.1 MAG: hypothetical protein A2310_07935 [candidate division WOR-1 bacterium RIFOXYB2_FULL_37_13]OGC37389.1 MAG: hypothetical protein A3J90_08270 [candidate division WOR-1 bacterium RIFOXYC2_FULL_37_10]